MARFKDVLLIEDDVITIMVCDRIIKMNGFADTVKSCENGRIAIDYLKTLAKEHTEIPNIFFLDINMPILDGWGFLEEFDLIKSTFNTLPRIFILSSSVDEEDIKKAKEYPLVERFISKPLTKALIETIT